MIVVIHNISDYGTWENVGGSRSNQFSRVAD